MKPKFPTLAETDRDVAVLKVRRALELAIESGRPFLLQMRDQSTDANRVAPVLEVWVPERRDDEKT